MNRREAAREGGLAVSAGPAGKRHMSEIGRRGGLKSEGRPPSPTYAEIIATPAGRRLRRAVELSVRGGAMGK